VMAKIDSVSTGISGLDTILQGLRKGDNVVWQTDDITSYQHFVDPFVKKALREGRRLVYIRFAKHQPLIEDNVKITTYQLDASAGFEAFSKELHDIITKEGKGVFYIFDCLSDLLSAWATDLMLGNFFMVTCPYLFKLDTVAYFALLRNKHSYKAIARIRETTQLLLDIFHIDREYYVHPLKVWKRHSPTMFLPHLEEKEKYVPIVSSVDATRLFSHMVDVSAESAQRNLDYWDRLFLDAEELEQIAAGTTAKNKMISDLSRIMLGREERMLNLVQDNMTLADILSIKSRMIGTGFIGGKSLGMLLARKILSRDQSFDWQSVLEPHDSFYIGSDVFYSYIVENDWWDLWLEQKTEDGYYKRAQELREKMLTGKFPDEIKEQFQQMIEYYGQSPIIVRSSSVLEDSFGNAFAGKYESIFCVNQGDPEERYAAFEDTVRQVFASALNEDALVYRMQRGLNQMEELMSLLVQRVSGTQYQHYFFPYMAGVGISYNTFVWHKDMDPKAGMLRLVFGLGTRAVNRVEGDYPRIVALDNPLMRPYSGIDNVKRFSQHEVDLLDTDSNIIKTIPLGDLIKVETDVKLDAIGQRDRGAEEKLKELGQSGESWVLTFDQLLSTTDFTGHLQRMLKTLEKNYDYPIDMEFTANFSREGNIAINLLQCRPLQATGSIKRVKIPKNISAKEILFSSEGNFMGGSVSQPINRIVFVDPKVYLEIPMAEKYEVARIIGRINRSIENKDKTPIMVIGPGRWGTRDPSLGVPVNFSEINNIAAMVEIDDPAGGFMPDLSYGSHFFLDLVETGIFYLALFADNQDTVFDISWLRSLPNILGQILPESAAYEKVLKVHDLAGKGLQLLSDITSQKVVCLK
ncbi:MAG: PEP/pyruvate-binding domain-containing protein, partial [bacterium]